MVLDGLRVIELTRVGPAALCTMILGDFGAEVVKVETPRVEAFGTGNSPAQGRRREAAQNALNRNKRSIALDLKSPAGQQMFRRLADTADVLVEGFRPGVLARLGVGYDDLARSNPRLIYCSMSGFGQDGPYRDLPGHDLNYIALGGVLGLIGDADRPPAIPLNLVADYAGASFAATIGILLAVIARQRTGRGQLVDVAYLDGVIALIGASPLLARFLAGGPVARRGQGVFSGKYPYYGVYEAADGLLLTLACSEAHLWKNFCVEVGREDWVPYTSRMEHFATAPDDDMLRVRAEVAALIRTRPRQAWLDRLSKVGVCIAPVLGLEEVVEDPQVRARRMIVDLEDPELGAIRQPGIAFKLSDTPGSIRTLGPCRGDDTVAILRELGYGAAEIDAARTEGVVE